LESIPPTIAPTNQGAHRERSPQHIGMAHIGRQTVGRYVITHPRHVHTRVSHIASPVHTSIAAPAFIDAPTDTIATVITGDKMKVSELKEGMLLRFKEPRIYKFLRDSNEDYWLDCGKFDPTQTLKWVEKGQPLMIYLGQKKMEDPSYYGGFFNVREVSIDGKVAWMWPDAWRYVEAI